MTTELKRLTQALGSPDFQLREIQREQRLMEAASRWPILRDVAPDYAAPTRKINVNLSVPAAAKPEPAVVRIQAKRTESETAPEAPATETQSAPTKGQLSNVFLRLKGKEKKSDGGKDKFAVI